MKNLKITLLALATIVFIGCSVETQETISPNEQLQIEQQSNVESNGLITETSPVTQNRSGDPNPIGFEHGLAWSAYIAGKVLFNTSHTSERSYFTTNYNSNSYVSTTDLFGSNPVHQGFKDKFIAQLTDYIANGIQSPKGGCPGGEDDGNPDEPIVDGGNVTVQEYVDFFMDWLTIENCTQFYFPDGLSFGLQYDDVTTLSHPLTSASSNEGIVRWENYCGITTDEVTVDATYVSSNTNIIVARPEKVPGATSNCNYSQYPDLTLFLQGPF